MESTPAQGGDEDAVLPSGSRRSPDSWRSSLPQLSSGRNRAPPPPPPPKKDSPGRNSGASVLKKRRRSSRALKYRSLRIGVVAGRHPVVCRRRRRARSTRCLRASAPDRGSTPAAPSCRSPSPRSASRTVWRAGTRRSAGRGRSRSRCGLARRRACARGRVSDGRIDAEPGPAWRPNRACRAA